MKTENEIRTWKQLKVKTTWNGEKIAYEECNEGDFVLKSDSHLAMKKLKKEIEVLRKNLDTTIMNYASILPHHLSEFTLERCKKEIDQYNKEIKVAVEGVK